MMISKTFSIRKLAIECLLELKYYHQESFSKLLLVGEKSFEPEKNELCPKTN